MNRTEVNDFTMSHLIKAIAQTEPERAKWMKEDWEWQRAEVIIKEEQC